MKNWRTSAAGLVTAFFAFVLFSPQTFAHLPWLVELAKFVVAGGLASMGLLGKDAGTHSTQAEVHDATVDARVQDLKAAQ